MGKTLKLLLVAWDVNGIAGPKPELFTVTAEQWLEYYDGMNAEVRKHYQQQGYYDVVLGPKPPGCVRMPEGKHDYTLKALAFRGTPVVIRSEYEKATADYDIKWRVMHL